MAESDLQFALPDAAATDVLGAALAGALPGRALCAAHGGYLVLYLHGELGAGKTACVRSLLRTCGVTGLIRSPTFTLVEVYRTARLTCVHVDLYRLRGPLEVDELGLRDYLIPGCLLMIEWPERAAVGLPPPDVQLTLDYAPIGRRAAARARTELGEEWLRNLRMDTRLGPYVFNLT
jgi:tRNA threonylcarbamoyladenosine biosynthesis protein TsaE